MISAWFVAPDFRNSPLTARDTGEAISWLAASTAATHRHVVTEGAFERAAGAVVTTVFRSRFASG
ncbi:hypothetical protein NIIDNTM18_09260 [Mycolicibacterium litorale]|uniref:Uncharacterized protein n=1 Tax=Mycolicibacterium litorale TaxID=758802 RepID=A0A6S6P5R1_9MYCO|nr:hypothetical protein NIIDNTM18_09260 [Mycolicibacterium litorale]